MIDVEALLAPIPGDAPAGPNLRFVAGDTTLDKIEELRREEDAALDPDGRGKEADWTAVQRACEAALQEKSKDLQLAALLTESLAWCEGFAGVLSGMQLTRRLLETYWDGIHPGFEDGEVVEALRARWLSWLGSSRDFLTAVKSIPITSGPGVEERGWAAYEDAERVDAAAISTDQTAYNEMLQAGRIPSSHWQSLIAGTPLERLQSIVETLQALEEELQSLRSFCDEKFAEDAPSMVDLAGFLVDCREYLQGRLAGAEVPADAGMAVGDTGGEAGGGGAAAGGGGGPISSRDEAFRRLREAAEYLRRTEPHSPVPYLVERAVNWGQMPFQEMLRDVLKDDKARSGILETLGMLDQD
ncbi:MAG TPA: type VI secretion system protein TssA [bacterium]|nr:type VI secretion system protein TssA [bacterium]